MCFGCSIEPSHRDGSLENPQHTFWLRNKEIIFHYKPLFCGPDFVSPDLCLNCLTKLLADYKSRCTQEELNYS